MTILTITNPMGTQPHSGANPSGLPVPVSNDAGSLAIKPSQGASSGGGSGHATSYSGFGAGAGGFGAKSFPSNAARPTDATSRSVVGAQAADQSFEAEPKVIDTAKEARETAAAMPDPLPTSPFLREIEGD